MPVPFIGEAGHVLIERIVVVIWLDKVRQHGVGVYGLRVAQHPPEEFVRPAKEFGFSKPDPELQVALGDWRTAHHDLTVARPDEVLDCLCATSCYDMARVGFDNTVRLTRPDERVA